MDTLSTGTIADVLVQFSELISFASNLFEPALSIFLLVSWHTLLTVCLYRNSLWMFVVVCNVTVRLRDSLTLAENTERERLLEECALDPTVFDKKSIITRSYQNKRRVSDDVLLTFSIIFIVMFWCCSCQCYDTVDWWTRRTSGLYKPFHFRDIFIMVALWNMFAL